MEINQDKIIYFFGIMFLLLGVVAVVNTLYKNFPQGILWFCYFGIIIIGVGMLRKSPLLIISQLNILFIPLLIWTTDFLYFILTGNELFGIVTYFFDPAFPIISRVISLQHLFTIPVSIYVLYKLKSKKVNAWRFSLVQLILIFLVTIILTLPEDNINCVYRSCMDFSITILPYSIVWFISTFLLVIITNYLITYLLSKNFKRT